MRVKLLHFKRQSSAPFVAPFFKLGAKWAVVGCSETVLVGCDFF